LSVGHVAVDDTLGQTLDDGGLADPRLADQHRIVLGAAREHLDRAADLLVTADHRVELALARHGGQVAGVFLECVVALLGRGTLGRTPFADLVDRRVQRLRRHAGLGQRLGRRRAGRHCEREQQAFGRDVAVAGLFGERFGLFEQARRFRSQVKLAGPGTFDLGHLGERRLDGRESLGRIAIRGADQVGRQTFLVVEQGLEQVFRGEALVIAAQCQALSRLDETARTLGVLFEVHVLALFVHTRSRAACDR